MGHLIRNVLLISICFKVAFLGLSLKCQWMPSVLFDVHFVIQYNQLVYICVKD